MNGPAVLDEPRLDDQPGGAPLAAEPLVPDAAGSDRSPLWRRFFPRGRPGPESIITAAVVLIACGFTFSQLQPHLLFAHTTPAGGDMGAHVWQPDYLRNHLLHHFRLSGWAPDWYAGFPSLVFYFPLPNLFIALLSFLLPYGIAFKLVSVAGLVALPLAVWAMARGFRVPFPGPACLAAASLLFLFSRNFTIYGGNIASTLAGEYAFSISLAVGLVFLGLVARGLETGRHRAIAAVLLAVTGLCHLLPTIFVLIGAIVLYLFRLDGRRLRWIFPVLATGGLLASFWILPFYFRLPYATDMGYEKLTTYKHNLFPPHLTWLYVLAAAGVLASVGWRRRLGLFLTVMAVYAAVLFRFAPQARLWNARVLPFWFLCLYLLAGLAVAEWGTALARWIAGEDEESRRWSILPVPILALAAVYVWVGFPLRVLPFGHTVSRTGGYSWLGVSSTDRSFIPDWVKWNYSGYESTGKARHNEYFALIRKMTNVGRTDGCGRAMWEYEPEEDQMGTPMALMLLPYWTRGCIGSMEGLYFESSATTPYHFLNAAELSVHPSNPVRGLHYGQLDVIEGVRHLQMLGVRYYMAITPETQAQADVDSELKLVATSGPWPVTYTSGGTSHTEQRTWKIYEVADAQIVTPLLNRPVVVNHAPQGGKQWQNLSESWYLDPNRDDVYYAASGPSAWQRVSAFEPNPPRTPLPPVQVSHTTTGDDSVSFDVDTTGVPVLVRTSYFPNWHVSGAKGPYRVTPNLMVVIPTSHHVRLHYGWTPVDLLGIFLSLLGVAGVTWLDSAAAVAYPEPRHRRAPRWLRLPAVAAAGPAPAAVPAWPDSPVPVRPDGPVPAPPLVDPYRRFGQALADAQADNGHEGQDSHATTSAGSLDATSYFSPPGGVAGSPPADPSSAEGPSGTDPVGQ